MILNRLRLNSKKRRHDDNLDQRAERITFDAVPGHRYSLLVIKLCILIYTRTNCGLRTVVKILEIFGEVFEGKCGKVPCYNTVENWMKKLWLFVEVRLQYHLTDKAFLLPPNMRTIARFMNMSSWVDWGQHMLHAYSILPKEKQEAYSFVPENKNLLDELAVAVDAVRHVEEICKTKGFNIATCNECKHYIIRNVIGNVNNRRAMLGIRMLDYFKKEEALLVDDVQNDNISSDIIESDYGIFKSKKSPNKLYGITPFVLLIPLYPKLVNKSVTDTFNFKERLVNVKLKDLDSWATKNMSTNWVTERTKIFRKAI